MANYLFAQLAVPPGDDTRVSFAPRSKSAVVQVYVDTAAWLKSKTLTLLGVSWGTVGPALVVARLGIEGGTVAFTLTSGTPGAIDPLRVILNLSDGTTKSVTVEAPVAGVAAASPTIPIGPGPVTGIIVGNATDLSIPVTYTAPTSGSQPITYSGQTRSPAGTGTFVANAGAFTATGGNFVGLTSGTTYDLKILTTNLVSTNGAISPNASTKITYVPPPPVVNTSAAVFVFQNKPGPAQTISVPVVFDVTIPANFALTGTYSEVAPTADMVFTIKQISKASGVAATLGTLTLTAGNHFQFTPSTAAVMTIPGGDVLQAVAPLTADATASGITLTVKLIKA